MIVKLLTEHNLEFLSLKGGCRDSSESTHVKMPQCWKSHALAHIVLCLRRSWLVTWASNCLLSSSKRVVPRAPDINERVFSRIRF